MSKKNIGAGLALYPSPLTVIGAMVNGKPTWTLVAHTGTVAHSHLMVSLVQAHYINKGIRENKKLHFWMNSGTIKISTINSFKGWESEVVYLVLEEKYKTITDFNMSFDELLYTGLTRCKRNLIILNFGNQEYDLKMRPLVDKLKLEHY